jgi:hypothetical protein
MVRPRLTGLARLETLLRQRAARGDLIGAAGQTVEQANEYHLAFQRWMAVGTLLVGVGMLLLHWKQSQTNTKLALAARKGAE